MDTETRVMTNHPERYEPLIGHLSADVSDTIDDEGRWLGMIATASELFACALCGAVVTGETALTHDEYHRRRDGVGVDR